MAFEGPITKYVRHLPIDVLKLNAPKFTNIILLIPGNPGLLQYYMPFMKSLYKKLDASVSIWGISHCCFSEGNLTSNDYNSLSPLELEVEHKLLFLEEEIPKGANIKLIGHSIGCYMIINALELLLGKKERKIPSNLSDCEKKNLYERINKCYFLFPTIQKMKNSPSGQGLWPILSYFKWLAVLLTSVVNILPTQIKNLLVYIGIKFNSESDFIEATSQLVTPKYINSMMTLAYDELMKVNALNAEAIETFNKKLWFYFGVADNWCPLEYRDEIVKQIPSIQHETADKEIAHAFVLDHSEIVADILAKIIKQNL